MLPQLPPASRGTPRRGVAQARSLALLVALLVATGLAGCADLPVGRGERFVPAVVPKGDGPSSSTSPAVAPPGAVAGSGTTDDSAHDAGGVDESAAAGAGGADAPAADGATARCPAEREGAFRFTNDSDGFCLLVPREVEVTRPLPGATRLVAPPAGRGPEAPRPELLVVRQGERPGLDTDAFARDFLASMRAGGVEPVVGEVSLDGLRAVTADGVPGVARARQAYLVREGVIYVLTLTPVDPDLPEATAAAEALWRLAVESFRFLDPAPDAGADAPSPDTPAASTTVTTTEESAP